MCGIGRIRIETLLRALGLATLLTLGSAAAVSADDLLAAPNPTTTITQPATDSGGTPTSPTDPVPTSTDPISSTTSAVTSATQQIVSGTTAAVSDTIGTVTQASDPVVQTTKPAVQQVADLVVPAAEAVKPVTAPVLHLAEPALEAVEPVLSDAADTLSPLTDPALSLLEPVTQPVLDAVAPVMGGLFPLTDPISDLIAPLTNLVTPLTDAIIPVADLPAGPTAPASPFRPDQPLSAATGWPLSASDAARSTRSRDVGPGQTVRSAAATGLPLAPPGQPPDAIPVGSPPAGIGSLSAFAGPLITLLGFGLLAGFGLQPFAGGRRRLWSPVLILRGRSLLPAVPPA